MHLIKSEFEFSLCITLARKGIALLLQQHVTFGVHLMYITLLCSKITMHRESEFEFSLTFCVILTRKGIALLLHMNFGVTLLL